MSFKKTRAHVICAFLPETKSINIKVIKFINGINRHVPVRIPSTTTQYRANGHVGAYGKVQSGILHRFISRKQRLKKWLHPVLRVPPSGHKLHRHVSKRIVWEFRLEYNIQDDEELNKKNEQFEDYLSQDLSSCRYARTCQSLFSFLSNNK